MNVRQKITLILLLTVVLGRAAFAQVVDIPDPNLRSAVRNELELSANAPITQDDMTRLNHLRAYHSDILNLSGLEFATQLEELVLGGNLISDLRALTGLTNLRWLVVPNCQISDISPLSGLEQLVELNLRENPISDLTPLVGLTELKYLDLGRCLIVDFSPLARLTNLLTLQINHNNISDIRLPSTLTSLRHLDLEHNQIIDVRPLSTLTSLQHLELQRNQIIDVQPLSTLTSLQHLDLEHNRIIDVRPLSTLTLLRRLELQRNQIIDVRPLSTLTSLQHLELQRNQISNVGPLSTLTSLRYLDLQRNQITDHTPIDSLSLDTFFYDQVCEMPPLPLEPRLENRKYPSVATAFSGYGWPPVDNRPDLSDAENIALHDLWIHGGEFGIQMSAINNTITISGNLDEAIRRHDELRTLNPNIVILMAYSYVAADFNDFPEDSPYWIRNDDGTIFRPYDRAGVPKPYALIDFTHPDIQDRIVKWAVAVSKCGLYDGIHFDSWSEAWPIIVGYDINGVFHVFRSLEAERRARLNIVQRIRAQTRPNFLITGNTNHNIIPLTGPYMSGGYMEVGWPEGGVDGNTLTLKNSLTWLEANLREPRFNVLEGKTVPNEPPDSPTNLRWVRALTTLSLTHSNGYVSHNNPHDQRRDWYDFWDADLGRPIGPKAQLYQNTDGLFIREFTNGWAVFNRSGEKQVITLPEEVQGVASGSVNTEHALPNLDGEMYLKKTAPMDSPDINGSDIYITDPIHAVPGAAFLLDASNNPGSIVRWVNLGTVGGTLLASDRHPTLEEGEIEIPSIGLRQRRKYYTATASRETFGGPVNINPQLYLGDWTLEFLCKRNGDLFFLEHHFAGFQNSPREGLQGIRLGLLLNGRELDMSIHTDGVKQSTRALNIFLEENVWTWVTIVSINGESIIAYQDGVEVSKHPGVHFDESLPIDDISIGSFSYDERERNFNGSFAIVRVYDRALSPDEVLQNIGAAVIPIANPADVNGDGVVNILDLVVVAQGLGMDSLEADVNGDGVVNVFDLVFVAGEIGGGRAAPSAYSPELSIISAADVERWLAGAQGLGAGDANFQRGIRFLQQLLAALTPEETTLLPNYPNPFNPETWIPYRLAREAEVSITIYDTKGTPVRRLALGNQSAGYYAARGKAAYWDGRNEDGEAVASGIYIYQFRAGDYAASRRMVIVK